MWFLEIIGNGLLTRFIMRDKATAEDMMKMIASKIGRGGMFRNEQSELIKITSEDGEAVLVADDIATVRVVDQTMWDALNEKTAEKNRMNNLVAQTVALRQIDHEFVENYIAARGLTSPP